MNLRWSNTSGVMPVRKVVLEKLERERERVRERNKQYKTKMLMPFGINLITQIIYSMIDSDPFQISPNKIHLTPITLLIGMLN